MIKLALFDLDGTLVNTNELIIKSFQYIFKKYLNLDVNREIIVTYFGEPLITTMQRYDAANAQKLCDAYHDYNLTMHDKMVKGYAGAKEALMAIKEMGVKCGIVTSKRRSLGERGLKLVGLLDLMDDMVSLEDTKVHKPKGEPVLYACRRFGISPKDAIYVGDSYLDILCGKDAGCKTCAVKYSALPLDLLLKYKPDYAVNDLFELKDIIEDENSLDNKYVG